MRCGDGDAAEPPDDGADRQRSEEVQSQSCRAGSHPHDTEPAHKVDIDRVLSFIDQMMPKLSKNEPAGN